MEMEIEMRMEIEGIDQNETREIRKCFDVDQK